MIENAFDLMRSAVAQAKTVMDAADSVATEMARILCGSGRLRRVSNPDLLRTLKRQLRDFDMTTGRWK